MSIGACTLSEKPETFYVELQPENLDILPEVYEIHQLNPEELTVTGIDPELAMDGFAQWLRKVTPIDHRPIFVALNAPFDWMFVNDYFVRYLHYNPFGHSALDIKALFMGLQGCDWSETGYASISKHYQINQRLPHNALRDAVFQAELFMNILVDIHEKKSNLD